MVVLMPSVLTLYAQESEGSEESELSPTHQVVEDLTKAVESKGAAVPSGIPWFMKIMTPKEEVETWIIEGSLETKVPTIWTDEKHSQEEAEPGRNSDL